MRVKTGLQKCKYGVYHAGCKRKDPCFGLNKITEKKDLTLRWFLLMKSERCERFDSTAR